MIVALQIAYLPALYGAFNRREGLVAMLESRAGIPAWGPEVLARHQLVGIIDTLPDFYASWEEWSADLAESHTTYPVLLLFRSPEPWFSWLVGLLAVLDGAAMHLAVAPSTASSQARLCLRMGFTALNRIAKTLGWEVDPDPSPEGPIDLTFEEFAEAVAMLGARRDSPWSEPPRRRGRTSGDGGSTTRRWPTGWPTGSPRRRPPGRAPGATSGRARWRRTAHPSGPLRCWPSTAPMSW